MKKQIEATSNAKQDAKINIKQSTFDIGTTKLTSESLASPAELFLGSFSACMLKNVERFSELMHFKYSKADVMVKAIRLEKPHRMDEIEYDLKIYSYDPKLNKDLLKKNIEKFGTIYNTVKMSCTISGSIKVLEHV